MQRAAFPAGQAAACSVPVRSCRAQSHGMPFPALLASHACSWHAVSGPCSLAAYSLPTRCSWRGCCREAVRLQLAQWVALTSRHQRDVARCSCACSRARARIAAPPPSHNTTVVRGCSLATFAPTATGAPSPLAALAPAHGGGCWLPAAARCTAPLPGNAMRRTQAQRRPHASDKSEQQPERPLSLPPPF